MAFRASPIHIEKSDIATLVFHGFTTSPQDLNGFIRFLANSNYTVYAPLLPGHGTSPEDLNKVSYIDWINSAIGAYNELTEKEYTEIYVIGHSMGSLLALRLGELFGNINGIVLTAAPIIIRGIWLKLIPLVKKFVKFVKKKGNVSQYAYDVWPIHGVGELIKLIDVVKKDLKSVIAPALIIHGDSDNLADPESAQFIYDNINSRIKRLVYIEGAGHRLLQDGDVARIYQIIANFIMNDSKIGI